MGSAVTHPDWELQRERLSAYLDSEVSADERASLEAHLPVCETCQRELAALRQMRTLLAALPTPSLPRSFALPAQPAGVEGWRRAPVWSRPAQVIGSIAAMVGLGLLVSASLPHMDSSRSVAGAATSAGAPAQHLPANAATLAPSGTAPAQQIGSATTAPSTVQTPVYGPDSNAQRETPAANTPPFPLVPVSGGVLLVGGVATAAAGSLARRRARRGATSMAS